MWPQHKVEVYEQMVAALRGTLGEQAPNIAPDILAQLEGILRAAEATISSSPDIVAIGLPDLVPAEAEAVIAEPAAETPAHDPFRHGSKAEANRLNKAKQLARWLWDRNIGGEAVLAFTNKWRNKIARAAGVNPPSTLDTWMLAVELMDRMDQLAASTPQTDASERHHLDEHDQWASEG